MFLSRLGAWFVHALSQDLAITLRTSPGNDASLVKNFTGHISQSALIATTSSSEISSTLACV